jgi:hypothetical protein
MSRYGQRTLVGDNRAVTGLGKTPPAGIGVVQGYGVATGGSSSTITVGGQSYTLLSFTSDTNLVVSSAGLFDVYIVGGGGGAGSGIDGGGGYVGGGSGGGGAGFVNITGVFIAAGTYAVDVGAGGATATDGSKSDIATIVGCIGGKKGGRGEIVNATGGASGASLVGATFANAFLGGVAARYSGAGGGAGGSANGSASSGTSGGNGGAGVDVSAFKGEVTNTTRHSGGGGGGSRGSSGTPGTGGTGGGGNAGTGVSGNGVAGTANSGGGGGGGNGGAGVGGAGGSGVVFVRFKV